jgi:hypothetical protein
MRAKLKQFQADWNRRARATGFTPPRVRGEVASEATSYLMELIWLKIASAPISFA